MKSSLFENAYGDFGSPIAKLAGMRRNGWTLEGSVAALATGRTSGKTPAPTQRCCAFPEPPTTVRPRRAEAVPPKVDL